MRCQNCGTEFSGNFCPMCGRGETVSDANQATDIAESTPQNNGSKSKLEKLEIILDRTNRMFIGSILATLFAFIAGYPLTGFILLICAVLTSPKIRVKFASQWALRMLVIILVVIAGAFAEF